MAYHNELLDFLAAEFGDQVAKAVQTNFGGQDIYIRIKPDEKQAYITEWYGKKTIRELSRDLGCSMRTIRHRLNMPISKGQQQLF
jgi:hypothetical protein